MVHRFQRANTLARGAFALFGVYLAAISLPSVGAEEARWVDPISSTWDNSWRWSTNPAYPKNNHPEQGASYDVIIDAIGSEYGITIAQTIDVDSLLIDSPDATVLHERGQVRAGLLDIASGTYLFGSGDPSVALADTLVRERGGEFIFGTPFYRLVNISFDGDFENPAGGVVRIAQGLNVVNDTTLSWKAGVELRFQGTQTIGGDGRIVVNGNIATDVGSSLTIGPGVTVEATRGTNVFTGTRIINEGTIRTETPVNANSQARIDIRANEFINRGLIEVGGSLSLGKTPTSSTWRNEGTIRLLPGSSLSLTGVFRTVDLGTIIDEGAEYASIFGTIDNRNDTLDFDGLPQVVKLFGTTIRRGTITASNPITAFIGEVGLNNVTLEADLELEKNVVITVLGDMHLSNVDIGLKEHGSILFNSAGSQNLSGIGTIFVDARDVRWPETHARIGGPFVTTSPGITIVTRGENQHGSLDIELLENQGAIISGRSLSEVSVRLTENSGRIVSAAPDSTVIVDGLDERGWKNTGVFEVNAGRLVLRDLTSFDDIGELIYRGGTVEVGGQISNFGKTASLDGNWVINGDVFGGRIEVPDGSLATLEGTLQDVTLAGEFAVTSVDHPRTNALGTLTLDNAQLAIGTGAELQLENHPFGRGSFALNSPYGDAKLSKATGLLIQPEVSISSGPNGSGSIVAGTTNQGTISAATPGAELRVVGQFRNNGSVSAINGGRFVAGGIAPLPVDSPASAGGQWLVDSKSQIRFEYENGFQFHENDRTIVELGDLFSEPLISSIAGMMLAGTLDVRLSTTRFPRTDREYPLVGGEEVGGAFASVSLPQLPPGFEWDQSLLTSNGSLLINGPETHVIAHSWFIEPGVGNENYIPSPDAKEVGFSTVSEATSGAESFSGVEIDLAAASGFGLTHRSVLATTTFDMVDLSSAASVELAIGFRGGLTKYERDDFVRLFVTDGFDEIDLLNVSGFAINPRLQELGESWHRVLEMDIPDDWQQASVVLASSSNSSTGAEQFTLDSIEFSGYRQSDLLRSLDGGGATYREDFDTSLGLQTGQLPAGWQAENSGGVTRHIDTLGLNDGPLGENGTSQIVNIGGSPERFGTADLERIATWKDDLNGDSLLGPEDVIADSHTDRALGNARAASDDPGTLSFSIPIAGNPLRAFTIDWDLEVWGGDPLAARRGGDGAGYAAELKVGGVIYYENRKTLFPGELFDTAFDGGVDDRNPTLIDGNTHAVRSPSTDIIEVDITDGAVGNLIELSFNANHGPDTGGWIQAIDNVQLRALAPGDTDGNGSVDVQDLLNLLGEGQFNAGVNDVTWEQGDFNGDDQFEATDLLEVLRFLKGQFPQEYATEQEFGVISHPVVVLDSNTGNVTVHLEDSLASSVIIDSAAKIFNVADLTDVQWNAHGEFETATASRISNTLFTRSLSGENKLGEIIQDEFLGSDFDFSDDLTITLFVTSPDGSSTMLEGQLVVVPEPATLSLFALGMLMLVARNGCRLNRSFGDCN